MANVHKCLKEYPLSASSIERSPRFFFVLRKLRLTVSKAFEMKLGIDRGFGTTSAQKDAHLKYLQARSQGARKFEPVTSAHSYI
jgi:hypothetical protein